MFVWDVATGVTTRRLTGHMGKVHVVELNQDASVLASGDFKIATVYQASSLNICALYRILRLHCQAMGPSVCCCRTTVAEDMLISSPQGTIATTDTNTRRSSRCCPGYPCFFYDHQHWLHRRSYSHLRSSKRRASI